MDVIKQTISEIAKSAGDVLDAVKQESTEIKKDIEKEKRTGESTSSDDESSSSESQGSRSSLDLLPIDKLELKKELQEAIKADGTLNANAFLSRTVSAYSKGGHVMVQSETGKERFRALAICALNHVDKASDSIQVLIISPYRDDATEILNVMQALNGTLGYGLQMCAAGSIIDDDRKTLQGQKAHVVIGTPGRIVDLVEKKLIDTNHVGLLLVDSAEKFFNRRSKRDGNIFVHLPNEVQYVFFVENVTPAVGNFIKDPSMDVFNKGAGNHNKGARQPKKQMLIKPKVSVPPSEPIPRKHVPSYYIYADNEDKKISELIKMCSAIKNRKAMILCKAASIADSIADILTEKKILFWYKPLEGNLNDHIKKFNLVKTGIIIVTFENARLVENPVSLVVNYNMPNNVDFFNKRIAELRRSSDEKCSMVTFVENLDIGRLISKAFRSNTAEPMPGDYTDCL